MNARMSRRRKKTSRLAYEVNRSSTKRMMMLMYGAV
jgi:hypothetical protein